MRVDLFSGWLCLLACSSALLAAEPPTSTPSQAEPATSSQPASTNTPASADTPASATTPSSTSTAAAPANAQAKTATAQVTDPAVDKRLRSQGYKRKVVNGQTVYCREDAETGSHFAKTHCGTAEQLSSATQQSRDFTDQMQRNTGNLPGH